LLIFTMPFLRLIFRLENLLPVISAVTFLPANFIVELMIMRTAWIMALVALLLAGMLTATGSLLAQTTPPATTTTTTTTSTNQAAVIVIDGVIDNYTRDTLFRRFRAAKAAGADTIIIQLNTPGGLVSPALDISSFIRGQSDVRTIAYIKPRALSAGIMIGLAADELYMSPGSLIGDSTPIAITPSGGLESLGQTERAKAESPILADFYASATRNGYDPLLTSAMVTLGRVVHYVQDEAGNRRFVDAAEYEKLTKDGWKPVAGVPNPIDGANDLLTVDENLAKTYGLSKGTFSSVPALASSRGLNITNTYAPTAGDRLLAWLGSGFVRMILIVVLLQALYFAFGHPGHGWPEAISLIVLGILVGVPMLTGYAGWIEVLAILIGLALLALEIFVIPGFGAAGVAGLLLVFGGLIMTFVGAEPNLPGWMPSVKNTWINVQRGVMFVTAALAVSLVLWVWLSRYLPKMPYFNRLILTGVAGDVLVIDPDRPVETGPAVGDVGVAITDLKPGGSVKFLTDSYPDGRVAAVVSDSGYVKSGTNVIVREVAGNRVIVRAEA
jgi:membrane-bound serine protease (ClpP class)